MSDTTPPPAAAIRKLRVGAVFAESHGLVFNHLGLMLKAAAVPYIITMVLVVLSLMAQPNPWLVFLATILYFVPYTLFGVAWHRLTLLGPGVSAPRVISSWTRRHWRFLGYAVAVMAIGYVLWFVVAMLGVFLIPTTGGSSTFAEEPAKLYWFIGLVFFIGGTGFAYLIMRFSFVFPAVAVEESYGLKNAWSHSRGQGFRLVGMLILTALPIYLASWLLNLILGSFIFEGMHPLALIGNVQDPAALEGFVAENFTPIIILHGILNLLHYLLMAVMVSAISIAFRTCTGWVPAVGGGAPGGGLKAG